MVVYCESMTDAELRTQAERVAIHIIDGPRTGLSNGPDSLLVEVLTDALLHYGKLERLRGQLAECEMGARGPQARMDRLTLLRAELKALEKGEELRYCQPAPQLPDDEWIDQNRPRENTPLKIVLEKGEEVTPVTDPLLVDQERDVPDGDGVER